MLRVTDIAHLIVRNRLTPGAIAIDATIGNGRDTVMLADAVGPNGRVFGFDIQATALLRTRESLGARSHVTLIEAGHETMADHLPIDMHGQVAVIMFNLGYLPSAAKQVMTQPATTIAALHQAISIIAEGGIITIIVYPGHAGGAGEAEAVHKAVAALPAGYSTHTVARLNSATPAPALMIIERLS